MAGLMPSQKAVATTVLTHACAECGMVLNDPAEFHPFIFCVLQKAGRDPWEDCKYWTGRLGMEMPERPPLVRDLHGPMDEHDDLVEDRLLARLERDGLLAPGLTAAGARSQLDG